MLQAQIFLYKMWQVSLLDIQANHRSKTDNSPFNFPRIQNRYSGKTINFLRFLLVKHPLFYLTAYYCMFRPLLQNKKGMRSAGIYLIQVQLKTARFITLPQGEIAITLRVGRNSHTANFSNHHNAGGQTNFNTVIQLNVDSTALQAQRCSVTLNASDKRILGIALISIPKDKNLIQSTYRVTQNEDKRAELELKIKISPFDSTLNKKPSMKYVNSQTSLNTQSKKQIQSLKNNDKLEPIIIINSLNRVDSSSNYSNINSRSRISDHVSNIDSEDRRSQVPKSFKVREEEKIIQISEKELKQYKDEKQAYYQLYQIEKGKNEIAAKFINNFLKKVGEKYPSIIESGIEQIQSNKNSIEIQQAEKKSSKKHNSNLKQQKADSQLISQLEQANRTLHRQVEEYKKLVEQMKLDIIKPSKGQANQAKPNNSFLFPGLLDFPLSGSRLRERSVVRPSSTSPKKPPTPPPAPIKANISPNQLKEIDFKKWIDLSIGQRVSIQGLLESMGKIDKETPFQKSEGLIKKLKVSFDKSFMALLTRKDLTKDALLSHKKQVNKLFEEIVSY